MIYYILLQFKCFYVVSFFRHVCSRFACFSSLFYINFSTISNTIRSTYTRLYKILNHFYSKNTKLQTINIQRKISFLIINHIFLYFGWKNHRRILVAHALNMENKWMQNTSSSAFHWIIGNIGNKISCCCFIFERILLSPWEFFFLRRCSDVEEKYSWMNCETSNELRKTGFIKTFANKYKQNNNIGLCTLCMFEARSCAIYLQNWLHKRKMYVNKTANTWNVLPDEM